MLSKKAQYAIYALMHLTREYNKGPVLIGVIAESEKLPRKFLEAILLELKNLGYVNSKKGKGGGYYLIKDPAQVNLADLVRHFDGALGMLSCVTYKYYERCAHCKDEETCGIRKTFKDLRDHTAAFLKNTSLTDVLENENQLKQG